MRTLDAGVRTVGRKENTHQRMDRAHVTYDTAGVRGRQITGRAISDATEACHTHEIGPRQLQSVTRGTRHAGCWVARVARHALRDTGLPERARRGCTLCSVGTRSGGQHVGLVVPRTTRGAGRSKAHHTRLAIGHKAH